MNIARCRECREVEPHGELYSQKMPREQDVVDLLPEPPKILERKGIIDRIKSAIENMVDVFEW